MEKNDMGAAVALWGRGQMCAGFRGNLRERNHLENPDTEGRTILKWIFRKWDMEAWTRLMWLRIRTWQAVVIAVMIFRVS